MAGKGDFNTDNVKQAMGNAGVEVEYEDMHLGVAGCHTNQQLRQERGNRD